MVSETDKGNFIIKKEAIMMVTGKATTCMDSEGCIIPTIDWRMRVIGSLTSFMGTEKSIMMNLL